MKNAKMINDCPLVYQIESPKPSSIIVTSVETNKIATNGENLGIAPNRLSNSKSSRIERKVICGTQKVYNIIFRTDELETANNADVDLIKYKDVLIWPQAYCKIDETRGQLGRGFIF